MATLSLLALSVQIPNFNICLVSEELVFDRRALGVRCGFLIRPATVQSHCLEQKRARNFQPQYHKFKFRFLTY